MLSELSLIRATQTSPNKRVSGSGFQPSPKSPSATSDTRKPLSEIGLRGGMKNIKNRRDTG